jgi:signal transduction histidine kinase
VLERGRSERVDSILDDPEVDQLVARRLGVTSAVYVPLIVQGRAIGVVIAHDREGTDPRFTDEDLRVAEVLASRAAIAVDLAERVSRDAVRRVVDAQEQERARLARELHDETGQALTSILLELKALEDVVESADGRARTAALRELVVETLQAVRKLAVELRPAALDDFGLVPALERLVDSFRETSEIDVQLQAGVGEDRLAREAETTLYRFVQEGLTNVLRHAGAKRVSISLVRRDGSVSAVIEDDGRGFSAAEVRPDALGLEGMRERAALLGGRFTIESVAGRGTTLAFEVPVE